MRFQSETSVFKFLLRNVDGSPENCWDTSVGNSNIQLINRRSALVKLTFGKILLHHSKVICALVLLSLEKFGNRK